jgi:hypothetical protein
MIPIEIQIDKLFTFVSVTGINEFSCKYFSIKCSSVYLLSKKITSQQSVFNIYNNNTQFI